MAGDWIKVEHAMPDKPEVWAMAQALGIDADSVAGKLLRVWIWSDQHTRPGEEVKVPAAWLDNLTKCPGFSDAMRKVGWLEGRDNALTFPRLDRHIGQSAKSRSHAAQRQSQCRNVRSVELVSQLGHNSVTRDVARERSRKSIIPRPLRRQIYDRDGHQCVYCGSKRGQWFFNSGDIVLSLDHVIPESQGGKTEAANLVTACMACNQEKAGRSIEESGMEILHGTEATFEQIDCCDMVVTKAQPEKRREEKSNTSASAEDSISSKDSGGKSSRKEEYPKSFEAFWGVYPLKTGKREAFNAWKRAGKKIRDGTGKGSAEAAEHMRKSAELFSVSDKATGEFCPRAATWLNRGCYDDDPSAWRERASRAKPQEPVSIDISKVDLGDDP